MRTWLLKLLIVTFLPLTAAFPAEQATMQVRVSLEDSALGQILQSGEYEVVNVSDQWLALFTDRDGLRQLRELGMTVEVIHEDVVAFYTSRTEPDEDYLGYKRLDEIYACLDDMKTDHPEIMTDRISIGKTFEGRDIWAVKISDNPDLDEEEPELLFNSLIHANEVMSAEVVLYFMDHLTKNYGIDPEITDIVDNRELWFIVVINPDGYYYNEVTWPDGGGIWRKTRRDNGDGTFGVDLNRNFGYMWAWDDMGSSPLTSAADYRGTGPFSEPESQTLRDFYNDHEIVIAADYHGYGNFMLWPFSFDPQHPPDENVFKALVDSMAYFNDYAVIDNWPNNGTHEDWSYGEKHVFSFTVEVGRDADGFWPRSKRIPEIAAQNLPMNLFLCRVADRVYRAAPPERPVLTVPEEPAGFNYTVSWTHPDISNPAAAYELIELQNPLKFIDSADNYDSWEGEIFHYKHRSPPNTFLLGWRHEYLWSKEPLYVRHGDSLNFWTNYVLNPGYCYTYVEVSTNGTSWESIPGSITTNDNPYGYNEGNGITGIEDKWIRATFDLADFVDQNIWIQVRLSQSTFDMFNMFLVDDIEFFKDFQTQTVVADNITDTQYDIVGQPTGDFFYRVRARDLDNQWGKYSNFGLVTVDESWVCGDTNGDGEVNQLDVTSLLDYLHRDGPAPLPLAAADVNGDSVIDQDDVKYLVAYLHQGGPEPICP